MAVSLSFDNEVFTGFAFYATVVILKMFVMGILTSLKRMSLKVFANQEDCATSSKDLKPIFGNEQVERVRRNHLNDLENIPAFVFLGGLYVLTDPSPFMALWHFRVFAFSRIFHMFAYQLAFPQPSRALGHIAGLAANISMAWQIIMASL